VIILKLFKQVSENVELIHLADNRDGWRSVVNAVMNVRVL
jgi:lysyl-tRNA synthetase class I